MTPAAGPCWRLIEPIAARPIRLGDWPCEVGEKTEPLESIARLAMRSGGAVLPSYSHPKSPQKFTQAQLLACLVLRAYLKSTYRGVVEILAVSLPRRRALRLKDEVPHYSTLKYFADRLGDDQDVFNRLLADLVRLAGGTANQEAAMDSTGLETTSASAHGLRTRFFRRAGYQPI